jgi:stage IV sporulation protein FB
MRSSYRLGRFFDIDVRVHITFFLLPLLMGFSSFSRSGSWFAALQSVVLMLIVFAFVVMHEYGHALTARRFGIRTRGITLYPIGGVAMLESMPKKPWQQILVAIAGPAVNFVLALGLALTMNVLGYSLLREGIAPTSSLGSLLASLFWVNMVMGLFNLIPALPMDGGRVLSAALALKLSPLRATQIASRVAKVVALAMGAYAVYDGHFMLGMIALFVWSASNAEVRAAEHRARTSGEGFTQVVGRTPWDRMSGRPGWSGPPAQRAPGEVVEVVEGPQGPEVRIFRPR